MWGVAPTRPFDLAQGRRVPFVSAKGTKTISARVRPQWFLRTQHSLR